VAVQRRDAAQVRGDRPDRLAELLAHPADLARAPVELLLAYQHGHGRADHEPEQRDHEHQVGECETARAFHGHSRWLLYAMVAASVCSRAPPIVRTTIEDVAPRLRIPTVKSIRLSISSMSVKPRCSRRTRLVMKHIPLGEWRRAPRCRSTL